MIKWTLAIGLHVVWLALFLYLWNVGGIGNVKIDSLAVSLSALQTVLVVFGFLGFGFIAIIAERTARETANKTAENVVRSELPALLRRELSEQEATERILGDESKLEADVQSAANSLDGDSKK